MLFLRAEDEFGDMGIVASIVINYKGHKAVIEAFFLSCRVFGRGFEIELLKYAKKNIYKRNINDIVGINSASEYKQVARDLDIVRKYHNRYHVCHISTQETIQLLKEAQKENLCVSGEVAPHHLILTEDNIKDCHPHYKMNPPLRSKEDHQALIQGLNEHIVTVIATDHAPHSKEEKAKPIQQAPFGIIGIQYAFPLLYTYLVKAQLVSLETILDALTIGPAQVLNLDASIEEGNIANLCIFDLDNQFEINEDINRSKSINTPFLGVKCYGKIKANILNGQYIEMEE